MREACRQFTSNRLGWQIQDRVVTFGSGVDGAVRRIETAFNKQGGVERITSFDSATAGSGNVVNEVLVLYNGFGQAIDTFQSHSGAVNLSTTPSVQMSYADGSANTIRPTGDTYPDGREVSVNSGHTSITSPQFGQCWTLDPTGNWHGFRQDDDGNTTWDLIQARTSNPVNEITDIDNTTGSSWATPSYDACGNMTTIPRPDLGADKAMTATWDAWNRLVKLVDPDTSDTLTEFAYDGRNFRIVGKSFAGGTLDETRHYYFTDSWQCLEERIDSSTDPERQHVWGIRHIDDLILRDRDTTGNGTLDERLYFLPDANWNVTAVVDDSGAVQERIEYTPYGQPQFLSPTFSSRTGSSFGVQYTYTSREWDGAVGLYYFRNRWYVPTLGVFCSRDPIGYFEGMNSYRTYLGLDETDPYGLACRIRVTCVASGSSSSGINTTCNFICAESGTKEERKLGWGAASTCEDIPFPYTYTTAKTVLRCFDCPGNFNDEKSVSDWAKIKNCRRAQCKKEVTARYRNLKLLCRLLGPGTQSCIAGYVAAEQLELRGCNFCNKR